MTPYHVAMRAASRYFLAVSILCALVIVSVATYAVTGPSYGVSPLVTACDHGACSE